MEENIIKSQQEEIAKLTKKVEELEEQNNILMLDTFSKMTKPEIKEFLAVSDLQETKNTEFLMKVVIDTIERIFEKAGTIDNLDGEQLNQVIGQIFMEREMRMKGIDASGSSGIA